MQEEGGVVITLLKEVLAVAAVAKQWRRRVEIIKIGGGGGDINSVLNDGDDEEVMTANPFLATIKLQKTGADFGSSNLPPPQDSEEHDQMEVAVTETCT